MMSLSQEFIDAAFELAEKVNGTLSLTTRSVLVIQLNKNSETADIVAATITNDDFPYCYVIPYDDSTLVFEV